MRSTRPSLVSLVAIIGLVAPGVAAGVAPAAAAAASPDAPAAVSPTGAPGRSPAPSGGPSVPEGPPAPSPSTLPVPIVQLGYEVVARHPHDTSAWTEGLVFDAEGRLFESTGINPESQVREGQSQVRELDPSSGAVLRSQPVPDGAYGEGLAVVDDGTLLQLTWKEGVATAWDKDTFAVKDTFDYTGQGEGWGLCDDGSRLVMSNGSDTLTFRDPATFAITGTVAVTASGHPLVNLNELECVAGAVWANVWETNWIVRIDPATGAVTGALDSTGLLVPDPAATDRGAVLNGIAKVPGTDTFLLTGKLWPEMIEVRITGQ